MDQKLRDVICGVAVNSHTHIMTKLPEDQFLTTMTFQINSHIHRVLKTLPDNVCVGHIVRHGHEFPPQNLKGRYNLVHLRINGRMELK